jgi:hypothetical protein
MCGHWSTLSTRLHCGCSEYAMWDCDFDYPASGHPVLEYSSGGSANLVLGYSVCGRLYVYLSMCTYLCGYHAMAHTHTHTQKTHAHARNHRARDGRRGARHVAPRANCAVTTVRGSAAAAVRGVAEPHGRSLLQQQPGVPVQAPKAMPCGSMFAKRRANRPHFDGRRVRVTCSTSEPLESVVRDDDHAMLWRAHTTSRLGDSAGCTRNGLRTILCRRHEWCVFYNSSQFGHRRIAIRLWSARRPA